MKIQIHQSFLMIAMAVVILASGVLATAQQAVVPGQESKTINASTGEKRKVSGMVSDRDGDKLTLRLPSSKSIAVQVGSMTQIREKKWNPFRKSRKYGADQLMAGLPVEVEGHVADNGVLLADKILITNDDVKTAQAVDARVSPVENNELRMSGQINELGAISNAARGGAKAAQETADSAHSRIAALDDYDTVRDVTVRFKVASAVLSEEARKSLDELAQQTKNLKGFIIEVAGYASSEGNPAFNQRLSNQRAEAVSEYLAEKHDIPLRRIMTPTGYGVSHPVSSNTTRTGRQENRRVEVRLMVSRGITAHAGTAQPNTENKDAATATLNSPR